MSDQGDLMKKAIEVLAAEYHAKTESVLILSKLPVAEAVRLRESFATQVTGRTRFTLRPDGGKEYAAESDDMKRWNEVRLGWAKAKAANNLVESARRQECEACSAGYRDEPADHVRIVDEGVPLTVENGGVRQKTVGEQAADSMFAHCEKGGHVAVKSGDHWLCIGGKEEDWQVSSDISKLKGVVANAIDVELKRRDEVWQNHLNKSLDTSHKWFEPSKIQPEDLQGILDQTRKSTAWRERKACGLMDTAHPTSTGNPPLSLNLKNRMSILRLQEHGLVHGPEKDGTIRLTEDGLRALERMTELARRDRRWQDAIRSALKPESDPFTIEPETVGDCVQCVRKESAKREREACVQLCVDELQNSNLVAHGKACTAIALKIRARAMQHESPEAAELRMTAKGA